MKIDQIRFDARESREKNDHAVMIELKEQAHTDTDEKSISFVQI